MAVASVDGRGRSAATSPYGTWVTSPGSGRNGSALAGWPVSASAPIVRPWKPPSVATTWVRPVSRDSLNAASFASAPELQKNTRPGRPARASSSSASADRRLGDVEVGDVAERGDLLGDGRHHGRVGVAERVDRDAAEQVDVLTGRSRR